MNKVIAGLLASSLMVSTAFAGTYTIGTSCEDPSDPNNYYAEFYSDAPIDKHHKVVFFNSEWACKVKKFRETDENVFTGKCVGVNSDDGVWSSRVELFVDYEEEILQVSFDGRDFIHLTEECK
jgi:hypothetical protein